MSDDILGRNPLEGGLDSVWKIPKKIPETEKPMVEAEPSSIFAPSSQAGEALETAEEWSPVLGSEGDGEGADGSNDVSDIFSSYPILNIDSAKDEKPIESSVQLVGFKLGDELFGIDIMRVQEIIRVVNITRVPKTAESVKGVVNLRGKVLPVVDLKNKFSFDYHGSITGSERIIIVNADVGTVGFLVDEVIEVLSMPESIIAPPLPSYTKLDSKFITGIGRLEEQPLVILDLNHLVSSSQLTADM